ncbi:MAG: maleylpyruvate isomerase family mycothiol-dependent enzyme [Catenulispora sp.]
MSTVLVYDMIVQERLYLADFLAGLSAEQMRAQTLCDAWTVRDVAAHLGSYLRFGQAKIYAGVTVGAGDFGPANEWLARRDARHSDAEIIDRLRRGAGSRTTAPRSGYDPVLTDIVLHDLDIRVPLGLPRRIPEDRLLVTFHYLTHDAGPPFAMGSRLEGLHLQAVDTGWRAGAGAPVRGSAVDLILAAGGRRESLDRLAGEGAALLRERVLIGGVPPVGRRMADVVRLLVKGTDRSAKDLGPPEVT